MAVGLMTGSMAFYISGRKSMLTTVRHIFGRIMHSETALCSQWDKGWKNNLLFASPSIRRPTPYNLYPFIFININLPDKNLHQFLCKFFHMRKADYLPHIHLQLFQFLR